MLRGGPRRRRNQKRRRGARAAPGPEPKPKPEPEPERQADAGTTPDAREVLDVLDWRRRTHELYRAVRDAETPAAAHALWCDARNDLFASHPASPIPPTDRPAFGGLPVAPYDQRYRVEVEIEPADEDAFDAATGTDGIVPFRRLG